MRLVEYILAWGVLVMSLAACSGKDGDEADKATSAKAVRVAIVEVDECLPLVVAEHLGLLDSLHADVRLIRKGSIAECRQAVESGEADVCVNDEAIDFKLVTSKKARIKRISQLNDKVIAADKEGHSYDLARMAVDSLLNAKQPVFIIQVEDLKVRLKMLTTGNVDAAMLPEPYATMAVKQGGVELPLLNGNGNGNDNGFREAPEHQLERKNGNQDKGQESPRSSKLVKVPVIVNVAKLKEPLRIAQDSIRRFGKENYERIWK
jgi:ABC-type nitrate/sulfonate/bicarbonate transport system substrate-binding protein